MKKCFLFVILAIFTSCASKPKLYPNAKYKSAGKEKANKDIDKCIADAQAYLESSKGKQVAKGAGAGAAIGAAVGAVTGLFTGDLGRSVVRSGAVGAAAGGTAGALSPDQIKRRYVNRCLAGKGYEVIGWD